MQPSTNAPVGRSVGVLIGGQAGAQLLTLLVSPVLTRLYDPHDFGTLAVFTSLLGCFSVVACLRYELAIALPAVEQEAESVVALSAICLLATSALCALGIFFLGDEAVALLRWEQAGACIWLLPVGIFCSGAFNVTEKWMVRKHHFGQLARAKLLQSVTSNLVQLCGYGLGVASLVSGVIVRQGMGSFWYTLREARRRSCRVSWGSIVSVARRYKNFPLYSTWGVTFSMAGVHAVPLVFSALFGASVVGYFAFALRLVQGPTMLIGTALCNVFVAHGPAARREGRLAPLVEELRRKLAVMGIPALVLLIFAAPDLFAAVFGERWRQAGTYARWMAPWIYLQFQFSPISSLAQVLEAQKVELSANFITFAMRGSTLVVCYLARLPADLSVLAFCTVSAVAYLAMLTLFLSRVGVRMSSVVAHDLAKISQFVLCSAPSLYLFDGSYTWRTAVAAVYFAVLSGCWLYRERHMGKW